MNKKTKEMYTIALRSGDWESYLVSFSPQEQGILKAIADTGKTVDEVVRKLIRPAPSIRSAITLLLNNEILIKTAPNLYAVANADFAAYLATTKIVLDKEEVAIVVYDAVYRAVEPLFMGLEAEGYLAVNGEHLAGFVAQYARNVVRHEDRWRKFDEKI